MNIIDRTHIDTPLGAMVACATSEGICLLEFTDRSALNSQFSTLEKMIKGTMIDGDNNHFHLLRAELKSYFDRQLKQFTIPVCITGTDFQQKVWGELIQIPYGQTRAYKQQANAIGNSKAVRAVANANSKNKIAIIIPCHRVIGSNGMLTGYAGGIDRKQKLLDLESQTNSLF